jgi:cytochrome P450
MAAAAPPTPSDHAQADAAQAYHARVEEFLNRFIYGLYARAGRPPASDSPPAAIISDPVVLDAILRAPDKFHKNFSLISALGHSRFSTNGEEWRWRRDLTQAVYARAAATGNRAVVAAAYETAFAACGTISAPAIQGALLAASTSIFFQAFGSKVAADRWLVLFDRARMLLKHLQYHSWVTPSASELSHLRVETEAFLDNYENEMRRSPGVLTWLNDLQRRGRKIDDFAGLDEFLMNFLAGVETTAATLSFAIDRLGIEARVQARLLDEIEANAQPRYLECFINETMRYFPAIPFVIRQAASDTAIGDIEFKSGQSVLLSVVGAHHDPTYWKEPEIFDCSRAEFMQGTYNRRAFLPFLAGPRMCGGAKLARMELMEGLKAFIRRFSVERKGDEIRFDYGLALRPNSWELVEIAKRETN